jgi:hypothetical protein
LEAKSVEDMVTLGPMAQATLVYIKKCLKAKEKNYGNSNISP